MSNALLGQMLVERGLLPEGDLAKALALQRERKDRLGKILVDLGFVSPAALQAVLSEQLHVPQVAREDLQELPVEAADLSPAFLRQFLICPFRAENGRMLVAMTDPLDTESVRMLERQVGRRAQVFLATETEILEALNRFFGEKEVPDEVGQEVAAERVGAEFEAADIEQLRDLASEAPVVRWVNQLIGHALERRASDIHLEPFQQVFRARFRIDGVLHEVPAPPSELRAAVTSRIKLMARLNIAEQRLPQDGRIRLRVLGREIDLRVSTLPTLYGESVVMRLLDRNAGESFSLLTLGFPDSLLDKMQAYLARPYGIYLVTGPTGSGKSTTLYSCLRQLNTEIRKIITIEDPVEYELPGVNQIQVNPQIGLTFATGLRHIVRQDPDVIMVGEIRDLETAEIAMRAALTGHLVFSTLHTNDAPSAVTRLTDMGVERYLVSSSVLAVLAQRLVRVLCAQCKQPYSVKTEALKLQGWPVSEGSATLWRAAGCLHCGGTGYWGRLGIFELMELNEEIQRLIVSQADANRLREAARARGMKSLKQDGWQKILAGQTTPEEVLRVTQDL